MGLFGRWKPTKQDGPTADTAFQLPAVGSASAVALEYQILGKLFGREGSDWRKHDRLPSITADGRHLEMFILGTRDGRRVIYFDITDVLGSADDPEPLKEIIDTVTQRQQARPVTIMLPKGAALMLYKVMSDVGPEVTSKNFDADQVSNSVLQSFAAQDIDTVEQLPLTLSVMDWVNVYSVTERLNTPSLTGEELVNDLRA